jgi:hypothetical protein
MAGQETFLVRRKDSSVFGKEGKESQAVQSGGLALFEGKNQRRVIIVYRRTVKNISQ